VKMKKRFISLTSTLLKSLQLWLLQPFFLLEKISILAKASFLLFG